MAKLLGLASSFSWHFKHFVLKIGKSSFEKDIVCFSWPNNDPKNSTAADTVVTNFIDSIPD